MIYFLLCAWVFCLQYIFALHEPDALGGQKRVWDLKLKLQSLFAALWIVETIARSSSAQDQLVLLTMEPSLHHSSPSISFSCSSLQTWDRQRISRSLGMLHSHTYCIRASNREWASSRAKRILQKYLGQPPSYLSSNTNSRTMASKMFLWVSDKSPVLLITCQWGC